METRIIRVAQGKHSTLSHLYINGLFACYLLEDSIRALKISGEAFLNTADEVRGSCFMWGSEVWLFVRWMSDRTCLKKLSVMTEA